LGKFLKLFDESHDPTNVEFGTPQLKVLADSGDFYFEAALR